jgi:hypothetical protein
VAKKSFVLELFKPSWREAQQLRRFATSMSPFAQRFQDSQKRDFASEVALVQLPAKDCFVHRLQLAERELFGKEYEFAIE